MARLVLFCLLLFAGACVASKRIVGGTPTTIQDYPAIVQVEYLMLFVGTWTQGCGANVLNSMFLLSAAHCFFGPLYHPSVRRIRAGSTYSQVGGYVVNIDREFNHPSYDSEGPNGFDGDITVLRLSSPLTMGPTIQQATIIAPGFVLPDNLPVVHAGWGAIMEQGPFSDVLLKVQVYTINNDLCRERYQAAGTEATGTITRNMICAGILDVGGRDACQGDSGGPLYYENILVGIVSFGRGCANGTYPGVSAAVSSYTNWILETAVL